MDIQVAMVVILEKVIEEEQEVVEF